MAEILITSFFTNSGNPITGLVPAIRIWEVNNSDQTLVIGATEGSSDPGPVGGGIGVGPGVGNDGTMLEMHDKTAGVDGSGGAPLAGSRDGFYKYAFDTINGYDPSKSYVFRVDGGISQPAGERYQAGECDATDNADQMVDLIYDEPRLDHLTAGSVGEAINQDRADISQLSLTVADVATLITLLLKYETNRTKVDSTANTLTIYDDDCITPLRTFSLLNSTGSPSSSEICERLPTTSGTSDGLPTCI